MIPNSEIFREKVFELLEVVATSVHRPKTIVLIGSSMAGKGTTIRAAANLAKIHFKKNFCLNSLDIDSTHPHLLLGGRDEKQDLRV